MSFFDTLSIGLVMCTVCLVEVGCGKYCYSDKQLFHLLFGTRKCRNSHQRCSIKIGALKNFAKFASPATLLKKEPLAQVFSSESCEIFKNTFFTKHFQTIASNDGNIFFQDLELDIFGRFISSFFSSMLHLLFVRSHMGFH